MKNNIKMYFIDTLTKVVGGVTPKGFSEQVPDGNIPFFKVSDMNSAGNEKYMTKGKLNFSERTTKKRHLKLVPKGSVIFPKIGGAIATNKKRIMGCRGAIDANTMALISSDELKTDYLYYFMLSLNLADYSTGSTMPQLSNSIIGQISIPVPNSVKEQKRVAGKIDKLFAEVDKGIEKTKEALKNTKDLLNSKLNEVFVKKTPKNWKEIAMTDFINFKYGKNLPVKKMLSDGCPVYGANGIIGYFSKFLYEQPQVLISCRGAYSGTINISPSKCFITNNSIIVEIKDRGHFNYKFLFYLLTAVSKNKRKIIITGAAQPQVTINNLITIKANIPFKDGKPDLKEQAKIARKLDKIREQSQKLQAKYKEQLEQFEMLKQSILNQAFQGKL